MSIPGVVVILWYGYMTCSVVCKGDGSRSTRYEYYALDTSLDFGFDMSPCNMQDEKEKRMMKAIAGTFLWQILETTCCVLRFWTRHSEALEASDFVRTTYCRNSSAPFTSLTCSYEQRWPLHIIIYNNNLFHVLIDPDTGIDTIQGYSMSVRNGWGGNSSAPFTSLTCSYEQRWPLHVYEMGKGAQYISGVKGETNDAVLVSYLINMFEQCASYRSPQSVVWTLESRI
jgi:hypothetical protein